MKYSPDLLKVVDHCQHRSFITNRYTGQRIAVDCGQCDYCIHKKAKKASMRVKTAGSAFKYSYFVTLTYDNEHIPLMKCDVLHSEYEDTLSISGDKVFGYERHSYIPVSEYQPEDSSRLRHIFFTQVQGTVPFDRELKEYVPVKDNWFLSMDAIRSFIQKTQSVDNSVYPAAEQYGLGNLIPFLNYVDVQNYIKRLRKHLKTSLGSYESLHFYAVGEYGPVHFRPHYHILLFTNSREVSEVLRQCHVKSWKFGRSDFQVARGGASSYVASYVNSLSSAPLLYRSCRAFKPRQRASLGFFEKGEIFEESEDVYHAIEQKIDSVINGRIYNFNGISVKSTPPMSYIRTLLPRFSSACREDFVAIIRIIRSVASAPQRMARFGIINYDSDSILSITRAYYNYIKLKSKQNFYPNEDEIILHATRRSTRCCYDSVDFDTESYINRLYRLFLRVSKFLRNWHLPSIGGNLDPYANRIMFIIKTGIEYEKKKDYQNLRDAYNLRSEYPAISDCLFVLPQNGQESDVLSSVSDETIHLLEQLRFRSATFCRDMIKHKKLNDANYIFNRMV
nr:MAG TPA: Replication associated protein [Microviridae sp.]